MYRIFAVNPGSTSTKVALFDDEREVFKRTIEHSSEELDWFEDILDQQDFRAQVIGKVMEQEGIRPETFSAVVGRGGLLPNMEGGGYLVNEAMMDAIYDGLASPHASNLGALLAAEIAEPLGIPAYIYDAVTADEFADIAKITGMPDVRRQSMCHVLNMKAVSRKVAEKHGKKYEDLKLIVAHLGGGISISIHENGRIVDAIRDDAGPFSPERAGSIPLLYVIDMCYSGKYNKKEMIGKVRGMGGIRAYLGTEDCRQVEQMIAEGNELAKSIYEAEAYQIAKGIGEMAPVLDGALDYIILTGGMAHSAMMTSMIEKRVRFIAPVELVPGENEMEALALGALRLLREEELPKVYRLPEKKTRRK